MQKSKKNEVSFLTGQVITARVKDIKAGTVHFTCPGARSAVLSMKALDLAVEAVPGEPERLIGRTFRVEVKAWYPVPRQVVLSRIVGEKRPMAKPATEPRKPDYAALPAGTVFLIDGANLLGTFDPQEAAPVLRSVHDGLVDQGYETKVFLEHRAWKYLAHNQSDAVAKSAFESLCDELDVALVTSETDLAILQTLAVVPKAVGLTRDRYADYAKAYPEIVGTQRLRGFSVTEIGGTKLVMVNGLAKAIVIKKDGPQKTVREDTQQEPRQESPMEKPRVFMSFASAGIFGYGNALLKKGRLNGAMRCFAKAAARHQAQAFAVLAEISDSCGDVKRARKLERLGEAEARRAREQKLRNSRLKAELRRVGADNCYAKCA